MVKRSVIRVGTASREEDIYDGLRNPTRGTSHALEPAMLPRPGPAGQAMIEIIGTLIGMFVFTGLTIGLADRTFRVGA